MVTRGDREFPYMARASNATQIPKGSQVKVTGAQGNQLVVEKTA